MLKSILLAVGFLTLTACATHQYTMIPLQNEIVGGQCASALVKLQKLADKESDDQLLYLMEYASALQICRDYTLSTKYFLQADRLAEQQDYVSLSRSLGATLFNEQMIQYKGDKFEKLFINAMAAINFIEMDNFESAMVEVRRINEKTKKFAEDEKRSLDNDTNKFNLDITYTATFSFIPKTFQSNGYTQQVPAISHNETTNN